MTDEAQPPQEIKNRNCAYSRRPDGIIVQRVFEGSSQTIADARANVATLARLAVHPKHPLLVDVRASFSMDQGVREYYAGPEAMLRVSAIGVLMGSRAGRIAGNLFLSLNAPTVPTRLFTEEAEAIAWLVKITRAGRKP